MESLSLAPDGDAHQITMVVERPDRQIELLALRRHGGGEKRDRLIGESVWPRQRDGGNAGIRDNNMPVATNVVQPWPGKADTKSTNQERVALPVDRRWDEEGPPLRGKLLKIALRAGMVLVRGVGRGKQRTGVSQKRPTFPRRNTGRG